MQLLTPNETPLLLSVLLSGSDTRSLGSLKLQFEEAFAPPDRFRACCAAVLLLEDKNILRLPQRLVAWYLLSTCDAGVNGTSPFLALIYKAASDTSVSPAERNFLVLLLSGPAPQAVAELVPRACAYCCDCKLLAAADWEALRQRALGAAAAAGEAGAAAETGTAAAGAPAAGAGVAVAAAGAAAPVSGRPAAHAASAAASTSSPQLAPSTSPQHAAPAPASTSTPPHPPPQPALPPAAFASALLQPPVWERPVPSVMTPLLSELKWLNPDLHGQLLWDSSMGEDPAVGRQQAAARELMAAALRGPLLPAQQQQLLGELDADPRVIVRLGLTPRHLPCLVEHAPVVATEVLLKLCERWPGRAQEFLGTLARSDMSLHSLEVVNRLTATGSVPTEFVHLYIANCIHSCESTQDKYVQNRLVRLVCVFLQSLIRNKLINIHELLHEVQAFCINFSRIREAAKLFRLLKQIEAAMRGPDGGAGLPEDGDGADVGPND